MSERDIQKEIATAHRLDLPETAQAWEARLIAEWRERANEYDRRDREETKRKNYVIAAQQAGLACGLRVCANELERKRESSA